MFSQYLQALRPESVVVPVNLTPRHTRSIRFHRFAPDQIRELMGAAPDLRRRCPVTPHAVRFLIGLLYSTGLRISEALNLDLGDVAELQPASIRFKNYFNDNKEHQS